MEKEAHLARKIIIALDVNTREDALALVRLLPEAEIFKVGLRLFTAEGPALISDIQGLGKRVFLDLKLHDIPNQVAGAVETGISLGAHMMTLHAAGGREMLAAAARTAEEKAREKGMPRPLLLAVTVLTSLKREQLREVGVEREVIDQVLLLARMAKEEGMDGVVCSPREIDPVKKEFGKSFLVVSPGIRPLWAVAGDQKRILTPALALGKGVDYMVIGRPVVKAPSPREAFRRILKELHGAGDASDGEYGA